MRGFGWVAVLVGLVVLVVGAVVGFNIGLSASVAATGVPAAAYPVYPMYGWGFGFPFFGLIFGLLFIFLIFGLVRRAMWGGRRGYGPGFGRGYGPGGYWMGGHGRDWPADKPLPPMADEMLGRWHRQAHGEPEPPTPDADKPAGQPS